MNASNSRALSNNFQDVRLISLASWSKASEISPRDSGGPFVVIQEGYDPSDLTVASDEFLLGRSGRWLSVGLFFRMPVEDRRAEFVFGTTAEVMQVLGSLPSKVAMFPFSGEQAAAEPQADDLSRAVQSQGKAGGKP